MFTLQNHPAELHTAPLRQQRGLELPLHYESSALVQAAADRVFDYADDYLHLSSHMSQSSWMMGGGRMNVEFDAGRGQQLGSRLRLSGRVLGLLLSVAEVVTERDRPRRKAWQTIETPRLLVIGHYRMGFEITPQQSGSLLRVTIDYAKPKAAPARWFGYLFGRIYAKWCTQRMTADAQRHFEHST